MCRNTAACTIRTGCCYDLGFCMFQRKGREVEIVNDTLMHFFFLSFWQLASLSRAATPRYQARQSNCATHQQTR